MLEPYAAGPECFAVLSSLHCSLHRPAHTQTGEKRREEKRREEKRREEKRREGKRREEKRREEKRREHSVLGSLHCSLHPPAHTHRLGEEFHTTTCQQTKGGGRRREKRHRRAAHMHRQACYFLVSYDIRCDRGPDVQNLYCKNSTCLLDVHQKPPGE